MGFRSYVRHFQGAILGLLCPSKFVAAAKGKRSQKNHFLSVSEVTLGIFGVQFWRFSVLQRHGVSLPGGDFFHGVFPSEDQQQQQQKPLQQQAEKVARIHSSSKRKKKAAKIIISSSFSMGFRSYVRNLPGGDFFHGVFPSEDQPAAAKASAAAGGKGSQNS